MAAKHFRGLLFKNVAFDLTIQDLKYDELIGLAGKENLLQVQTEVKRGRKEKCIALALIERLVELKDSMLLFVRNFEVPFTKMQRNEQSENSSQNPGAKEISVQKMVHAGILKFVLILIQSENTGLTHLKPQN